MKRFAFYCTLILLTLAFFERVSAETSGAQDASRQPAPSATITVNSTLDTLAFDGQCTLREAIENAEFNNLAGSPDCATGVGDDTILFDFGGQPTAINITRELEIQGPLTIDGSGAAVTLVGTHPTDHTFRIIAGSQDVTLRRFTITDIDQSANGSAIFIPAQPSSSLNRVMIDHIVLRDNYANGGAALSAASNIRLDITNSQFIDNQGVTEGGAIGMQNTRATIANSTFRGNRVNFELGGWGGAILHRNTGTPTIAGLTINNSTFDNNHAEGVADDGNSNARGGAIYVSGNQLDVQIKSTTFSNNTAQEGGAIYAFAVDLFTISNSTLSGNVSERTAGGLSLSANNANLDHNTFYGNRAPNAGQAVYFANVPGGIDMAANIVSKGGGLNFIANSCVTSAETGTSNIITSGGGNVVNGCADQLTNPTDQQTVSISSIGALANNGGVSAPLLPPLTHAITSDNSPAYDAQPSCTRSTDQRGAPRSSPACDAGAFEFGSVPTAVHLHSQSTHSPSHWAGGMFLLLITSLAVAPALGQSIGSRRSQ